MLASIDLQGWGTLLTGIASVAAFVNTIRIHRKAGQVAKKVDVTADLVEHKMTQHDEMINVLGNLAVRQQDMANGLVAPFLDWYRKEHGGNGP